MIQLKTTVSPSMARPRKTPFSNPLALQKKTPRASTPVPTGTHRFDLRAWGRRFREKWSWKKFFIGFGVFIGVLLVSAAGVFAYYVRDLPNPHQIQQRPLSQSTQILASDGTPLYSIHGDENRTVVQSAQISPYVKEATVSVEDASFYSDYGFSVKGLARAILGHIPVVKQLLPADELSGGGSTITQQYIKNEQDWTYDDTISRKLKELILSIEVERMYSKDDILTGYLNIIPYGSSAYGIQAAAQTYFNENASQLTLSQAATLAAIPNSPTFYSPYGNNLSDLFERKDYILDRMVDTGYITKAQATAAKAAAPTLANPNFTQQAGLIAPHFVFYVRQQLINFIGGDPETAEQELDSGGYTVTTSLDLPTQNIAQQVMDQMGPETIKKYHASNACLVSVNPTNGEVLAMVGSVSYSDSVSGETNFCTAGLQPGSSFKPFVYSTDWAPGNKLSPSSITYDLVTNFGTTTEPYQPTDYNGSCEYCGPVTDRDALDGSLNIPAVKNLYLAGISNSIQTAQKMGISTLTSPPSSYGLSLVLGSGSVEPVEMADAYATFANGGEHYALRPILTIKKDGVTVKDYTKDQPTQALTPEVAYEINNVLSDNSARTKVFGANSPLTLGPSRPVAAKSGTTENFKDGWVIGYTPSISTAVWVGNNLPNQTMTVGADGSFSAGPIWNKFMSEYLTGKPVQQFSEPSDIKTVSVDKLSGKLPTDQTPSSDLVSDIFAPWQVPTTNDDVHVKVNIDKVTGLLATSLTPADDVEQEYFFNVHSEEPSLPNWEGPVQTWAKANGGGTSPPTDSDNLHTAANQPTIKLTSPSSGANVSGAFTISATPGGSYPITQVEFFLNNVSIGVATQSPYQITYQASALNPGSNVIQAVATNSLELTQTDQVTVTTSQSSVAPDNVSGLSASQSGSISLNHPIHLSWTNPSNTNLASVNIYESQDNDPNDKGSLIANIAASPNSSGSYDVSTAGMTAGRTYYFIVHPVSSSGSENQSTTKVSSQVLP
jgi:membrane peptidoglycan carboxypeptidase